WAVSARSVWEAIEIGPEALSLISAKETVSIARQDIVKLSLDKRILVIKWQAQPKVRLAVIGKERFSAQAWEELQTALQGWAV
uniref:hypothetical protein n=1 Tax=Roseateles sp. TaxID=1971397 RepID=UPI0031DC3815